MSDPDDAPAASQSTPRRGALVRAAAFYFGIVFATGMVLGPVRVLWLEPWIGPALAVLCEAPFLIAAMWFAAGVAPTWAKLDGGWPVHLAFGVLALVFQQIADLAAGFGLRGMTLADQIAYFGTPAGAIYVVTLVIFALTPAARRLLRRTRA